MSTMMNQVADIAVEVRDWAEVIAEKEGYREDLNGMCAIASSELWKRLTHHKIKSKICMCEEDNGCHVFLNVEDHIVCITATQFYKFRNIPILIRHEKEMEDEMYYRNPIIFKNSKMLRTYQINEGWEKNQIARR